jgi:NAD(P)-dependent dehydrogenase (short-subunit alcohol dehydrogenase family)
MIAIITGAYGAIGKAIVEGVAQHGFEVVMVGRNEEKLMTAVHEMSKKVPGSVIHYKALDLSREKEIINFSREWTGPLHLLINNAATAPRRRTETPEGIEMQFAANVLSYFWMTHYFLGYIIDPSFARIVNVASYWAGDLDLRDLEFRKRNYNSDTAYRQSKQANRMLTAVFAEQLKPKGITINVCHPGDVNSKLSNDLGFGGHETPEQGADTPVWLAVSRDVSGTTGQYFEHRRRQSCPFIKNKKESDELFQICLNYCTV